MNDLPATMSGVQLPRHGGPEALEWRDDIPLPRPGAGQVLVEVLAAGINNTDINTRIGWYAPELTSATDEAAAVGEAAAGGRAGALRFPRIQGGDLCGRVVAVGPGVSRSRIGQRVTCPIDQPRPTEDNPVDFIAPGPQYDGAFAEYCLLEERDLHDVTEAPLSNVEIAAMPCAFGTAAGLLHRAGPRAGQEVLITGASGGVGLAAVQLAARAGAHITAICSSAKADIVRGEGAVEVIDRDAPLPEGRFPAVIDVVAGPAWPALVDALRPGGHYAVAGAIAGPIVEADLRRIYLRDITIHGCTYQPPGSLPGSSRWSMPASCGLWSRRPVACATSPARRRILSPRNTPASSSCCRRERKRTMPSAHDLTARSAPRRARTSEIAP